MYAIVDFLLAFVSSTIAIAIAIVQLAFTSQLMALFCFFCEDFELFRFIFMFGNNNIIGKSV